MKISAVIVNTAFDSGLSSFLIDVAFGVVVVAAKTAFDTWAASVLLYFWRSVCLVAKLVFGRLLAWTRLSTHFSLVHSVIIVCVGNIRLLFKLLLNFLNVLKKYRKNMSSSSSSLLLFLQSKLSNPEVVAYESFDCIIIYRYYYKPT